uniref:Uncharacterized protein n=1 Tax=Physcomitrium patens TaxID=3218 RepID=A0A2K1KQ48_PHYPA|nr:hypothetical protein PHYPA_006795 [Physcomitrium patens]
MTRKITAPTTEAPHSPSPFTTTTTTHGTPPTEEDFVRLSVRPSVSIIKFSMGLDQAASAPKQLQQLAPCHSSSRPSTEYRTRVDPI